MQPSEVFKEDWICRFITADNWLDELKQPSPSAFRASSRQLSVFSPGKVEETGSALEDLCIEGLKGAGQAHLQVSTCIDSGQGISEQSDPQIFWRPDKVAELWETWKDAHAQIESSGGDAGFPLTYRSLLAEKAICTKHPQSL